MPRVKTGKTTRARHKKVMKEAKGYFGSKHRLYKSAKEQVMNSRVYAYRDRKQKKSDFRKLWITRINATCRMNDISYSKFINGLNIAGIEVNRKMLSEIAIDNEKAFADLVVIAKDALAGNKKVETKTVEQPEKKETPKKEVTTVETTDLTTMKVAELRELAKDKDIKGYSTMKKDELINALK